MLILEIRLLTGRYAAGRYNDPARSEWPPHPARVFSALTAAHHDDPDPSPIERRALEWIAGLGAPEVHAALASERQLYQVFVPVNDPKALSSVDRYVDALEDAEAARRNASSPKARLKAEAGLRKAHERLQERSQTLSAADGKGTPANAVEVLERRPRRARPFPVAVPESDIVVLRWPEHPEDMLADALDALCGRVARLGHSSSLVSMRLVRGDPPQLAGRWVENPGGEVFLRVPLPNQLQLLEAAHERYGQIEPRVLPSRPVRYTRITEDEEVSRPHASVFSHGPDEWIVYEVVAPGEEHRRRRLDTSLTQRVARAMRGTILGPLGPSASEMLSGHTAEGEPARAPHLAFVPLSDVGHPHATGSILGVGLIPPSGLSVSDRDSLLEAVFRAEQREMLDGNDPGVRLTLGRHGVLHLRRLRGPSYLKTLQSDRWCRAARRWASVTAVALDRNPGNLLSRDGVEVSAAYAHAEDIVRDACANVGLPKPDDVWIHRRSLQEASPAAKRFQPFPDGESGPKRVCVHVELHFSEPVIGPVLLGAGRFFGLGLCAPRGHG